MSRRATVFVLSLLLVCCTGCQLASAPQEDFFAFRSRIDTARQSIPAWTEEEKSILSIANPDPDLLTDEEIVALVTPTKESDSVLPEESKADVELLFRAMKSAYGAYDYLGGDTVFLPVQTAILEELAGKPPITGGTLSRLLHRHLAQLLQDGHFAINGTPVLQTDMAMYYVPDLYFSVGAATPQEYTKPTISPDGELCWWFAALSTDGSDLPNSAVVSGKDRRLNWVRAEDSKRANPSAYQLSKENGVPVLRCNTLSATEDAVGSKELSTSGGTLKDEPVFLVDLRGNSGGNAMYAMKWFRSYAESDPAVKTLYLQNCSKLFSAAARGAYADSGKFIDQVAVNAGTWETARSEGGQVTGKNMVFVLQDGNTASAGERFVTYISSLEHTIRVGSNTAGCSIMGNVMELYLPNSGLSIRFGGSLDLYDGLENKEGLGLLPDLWVPPQQAEQSVQALILRYQLTA